MAKNQNVSIYFDGLEIGKVGYDENNRKSSFQYNPEFLKKNVYKRLFPYIIRRISPVQIFAEYEGETFRGLPPMIADSLPDYFGNIVFKEWLEATEKDFTSISPLEQLAYVGQRAMGALQFIPAKNINSSNSIDIEAITEVVKNVLDLKKSVQEKGLSDMALLNIFKIGTSAGGARPKIIISEHKQTKSLFPGDLVTSTEYNHYLIKLSIDEKEQGYSKEKVEFIYYKIATSIGIEMMTSKLINDKHFATERFDRQNGEKQHILTACGIVGWDFKKAEHSKYENLFKLALDLKLPHREISQLFKRMVFNLVFFNIDDHLKNFSFIYNKVEDSWNLAPAYDLTYPLDALLNFTKIRRVLSINNKRSDITRDDLLKIADLFTISNPNAIIDQVVEATSQFRSLALENNLPLKVINKIESEFILV